MKKLFFIVFIFFLSITSSFAVFFIDGQGDYMSTGDFKPVTGFGLGIGFGLADDVNFLIRCATAENTENSGLFNEIYYSYSSATVGIEYIPPMALLDQYRIYWKNTLNIGAAQFETDMSQGGIKDIDEVGVITSFKTGLQYNFTQVIAPYFNLGYHKFFSSTTDSKLALSGWQIDLGVRIYILGSRDYNSGY